MPKHQIPFARTVANLRAQVDAWHAANKTVALVPTMGALHTGHLSLVKLAETHADHVVVSIFVNPTQFAANEDLGTYPRDEVGDVEKLSAHKVDLIYAPTPEEMYPEGFSTTIAVNGISDGLCGSSRPHFFGGVATVVAKLFLQCRPDVAVFGEKDYQQLLVIRRMARDLDLPVNVIGAPIVREPDGLAMSSRNAYLSEVDRKTAPKLNELLRSAANLLAEGRATSKVIPNLKKRLSEAGFDVDYLEVRHAETLAPLDIIGKTPTRLFAAAILGKTRLIDNVVVPAPR